MIDFIEAQKLWDDPDLIEIPVRTEDEPKYMIIRDSNKRLQLTNNAKLPSLFYLFAAEPKRYM